MRTPRWRYRIYEFGAVALKLVFLTLLRLAHLWSLLWLVGEDRAEYLASYEGAKAHAQELANRR